MDRPRWLALLAEAYRNDDQGSEALAAVSEALAVVEETGECLFEAWLRQLNGEVLLKKSEAGAAGHAEACLREALEVARRQQAKSWELRVATSLARLWAEQGKSRQAYDVLAPVYHSFTEGFDTDDLKEARTVLEPLACTGSSAEAR